MRDDGNASGGVHPSELTPQAHQFADSISCAQHLFFGNRQRPFQRRLAICASAGLDIILIAPNGSGKSEGYTVPLFKFPGKMALVFAPFTQLLRRHVARVTDSGLSAIMLDAYNIQSRPDLLRDVASGRYQMVFIEPDRLMEPSSPLHRLVNRFKTTFTRRVKYLVVEECHLAFSNSSQCRKAWGQMGKIRAYFPFSSVVAVTATLDREQCSRLPDLFGMKWHHYVIERVSCDRPNIFYAVTELKSRASGYQQLGFLVPSSPASLDDFTATPTTAIFMKNKFVCWEAAQAFQMILPAWAHRVPESSQSEPNRDALWSDQRTWAQRIYAEYHDDMSTLQKSLVCQDVRSGVCKGLFCAVSTSLGLDVMSVELVVQWGITKTSSGLHDYQDLMQRFSRVGRGTGCYGVCLTFVEPSVLRASGSASTPLKTSPPRKVAPSKRNKTSPPNTFCSTRAHPYATALL
ncbi:hypothetical protein ABW21_db0205264 [Orbilia brochopaga]|nr:hypothetical protein ABW21_db0205264 [Drechslerella brochopaga]